MKLPSYLKRSRHGVYYFRVVGSRVYFQSDCRKAEFSVSLRTTNRVVAANVSRQLTARLNPVLPMLRAAMQCGDDGAEVMINDVKRWLNSLIGRRNAGVDGHGGHAIPATAVGAGAPSEALRDMVRAILLEQAVVPAGSPPGVAVEVAGEAGGAGAAPAIAVTAQLSQALNAIAGALQGLGQPPSAVAPATAIPIATSIEDWAAKFSVGWTPKSRQEFVRIANLFAETLARKGVYSLEDVKPCHVEEHVRFLLKEYKLPFKRRGKEFGLTPKTVTKHVDTLAHLFTWAQNVGRFHGASLPTSGQRFGKRAIKKTSASWLPLTQEELLKLFAPETFLRWAKKPHQFFVMLIMLFHGLRVSEASQLAIGDFQQMEGLWTLRICEEVPNSRIKTEATKRKVPLHPALIRLGILRYIDDVRRLAGDSLLFPYLNPDSVNGYGDIPGDAINKYMDRVLKDPRKRGHSFRHTTNNTMRQAGVSEEDRCEYIGHEHPTTNSEIYSELLKLQKLGEIVFPTLDFKLDEEKLRYESGRYDAVLRSELDRRRQQQAHKAAKRARAEPQP